MELSTKFISATKEYSTYTKRVPAPALRRAFTLEGDPRRASLSVCGLGFYELYVNGRRITRGRLSPYISNPDHLLYYDTYDLTRYLQSGENVIGVILGNGMQNAVGAQIWRFDRAPFRSAPKLALSFEAEDAEGGRLAFEADETFLWKPSPIIFDDLRIGEDYDARVSIGNWSAPGYDASDWRPTIAAERPRGVCIENRLPPITQRELLSPVDIHYGRIGLLPEVDGRLPKMEIAPTDMQGYIYDFGKNSSGVCRLHLKGGEAGRRIVLRYAEKLTPEGDLDLRSGFYIPRALHQRDVYITAGGEEEYAPTFTYHGFRYCMISGIKPEEAVPELLTYEVFNTSLRQLAHFECSDGIANRIWEATLNSDLSNFHHFPTDCPHREKNGWTGDILLSAEQLLMAFDCENSLKEWLRALRASQLEDGQIPGVAPTGGGWGLGHGPAWDGVLAVLPYYIWHYRGDREVLVENSQAILRYLGYMTTRIRPDGLLDYGLGDWCQAAPGRIRTPTAVSSTIAGYDFCRKAAEIFEELGQPDQAAFASSVGDRLRAAAERELVQEDGVTLLGRSQTGQAMGIYYGIFSPGQREGAIRVLLELIEEEGGSFDCGILGLRVLFHVLSAAGRDDLAWRMITKTSLPSYGYMIDRGATTLWETFHDFDGQSPSLNHHFFGDVINWFMRNVAGIQIDPQGRGPRAVRLSPAFIENLDHASGDVTLPVGRASLGWRRRGDRVDISFDIPEGVTAELALRSGWRLADGRSYKTVNGRGELTALKI